MKCGNIIETVPLRVNILLILNCTHNEGSLHIIEWTMVGNDTIYDNIDMVSPEFPYSVNSLLMEQMN